VFNGTITGVEIIIRFSGIKAGYDHSSCYKEFDSVIFEIK
jgi:hypothetical protein